MLLIIWLIQVLLILLSVAFFTLFERKIIGAFHIRLGPNKTNLMGLFQPLLDAFKLLTKQVVSPLRVNKLVYNFSPQYALLLSLLVWVTLPFMVSTFSLNYSLIVFFCVRSFIVFSVLIAGWSSNSKYSLIGSLRSVAQSISYESVFRTLFILIRLVASSFSILSLTRVSKLAFFIIFPLWLICVLAETHRAPFDFRESESELVSGFNTEYSGAYFAFVFLSEYRVLLFSCVLITYIFIPQFLLVNWAVYVFFRIVFRFIFIWIRITFCRFRYDMLIILAWKTMLPVSLILFVVVLSLFF